MNHTHKPSMNSHLFHLILRLDLLIYTSSTRTRRGGSCLKDIYIRPFSSIELACAVRQPSPCVRALCETGVLFHMSHLKLHFTLHTRQSSHSRLHTSHSTLRSQYFTLHSPHFTLHTPHFTLHTPHFTLHTPHFILHTPHFTLHSSELFSPYPSSFLLISSLLICQKSFRAPASSPTHSPCNIMQQFQCNLQPEIQEPHRTTHTDTTTRCKTHRRNNSRTKRPQPQPPHRRGSFHRRLQPLYTEKHKVSCSGFLPNTQPMQHHAAIISHYNAFRSIP